MIDKEARKQWIYELAPFDDWNERYFAAIFAAFGRVDSYLDIGCGTGAMVNLARSMGIDAMGIDQIGPLHGEKHLLKVDLTQHFELASSFDLVSCIEVAEHILGQHEHHLINAIVNHMHVGSILVFSAATPGQDGIGHVNCRLGSYWRNKFYEHGVSFRLDYTQRLQIMLLASQNPLADHLIGNLQVFDK